MSLLDVAQMDNALAKRDARPRSVIEQELREHLDGDGTGNDMTTDSLYREWHRVGEFMDTILEEVELWAWEIYNEQRHICDCSVKDTVYHELPSSLRSSGS